MQCVAASGGKCDIFIYYCLTVPKNLRDSFVTLQSLGMHRKVSKMFVACRDFHVLFNKIESI